MADIRRKATLGGIWCQTINPTVLFSFTIFTKEKTDQTSDKVDSKTFLG